MKYRVMAIDPGTQHTGVAVGTLGSDGTMKIREIKKIEKLTGKTYRRISEIIEEVRELIDEHGVKELWTEMFVPYGIRRGAMHNMNLVGALLYIPVTRNISMLSYSIQAAEWKKWVKANVPDFKTTAEAIRKLCVKFEVELTDEWEAAIADPHCADAVGILLFSYYGSEAEREYQAGNV